MSRSRRKHQCMKICGRSDKLARSLANRCMRRSNRIRLRKGNYELRSLRESSDTWSFPSDGLAHYMYNCKPEWLRK